MSTQKQFELKSSSEGFASRSKDVFANIDSLAASAKKVECDDKDNDNSDKQQLKEDSSNRVTEDFKGRESIFHSPNETGWPPRSGHRPRWNDRKRRGGPRRVPDHVIHPSKYTKYDLSDVSKDQLSDRSNSRAAFDFLRQLKDRKNDDDDQEEEGGKVSFKQPPSKKSIDQEASTSSSNVVRDGTKRVMPECVVGQKRTLMKNTNKKSDHPRKSSKQVSLSHLDDDEDDN